MLLIVISLQRFFKVTPRRGRKKYMTLWFFLFKSFAFHVNQRLSNQFPPLFLNNGFLLRMFKLEQGH